MFSTAAAILLLAIVNIIDAQSYTAGVVVYKPVDFTADLTAAERVRNNTLTYVEIIKQNKDVDILVFPEYGIADIRSNDKAKEHLDQYSTVIGNVSDAMCIKNRSEQTLVKLSCAANEAGIYVIANLVEKEGDKHFVTTIGIDPRGTLCLKCRKHYITTGTHFEISPDEKSCTFTATFKDKTSVPFLVLFGTDLVHEIPEGTEHVIMSSSIKNTLPLNVGFSLYQGFAISKAVNLLVSGYYEKNTNSGYDNYGGSGIYFGNGTSVSAYKPSGPEQEAGSGVTIKAVVPLKSYPPTTVQVQSQLMGDIPKMNLQYMNIPGINDSNKTVTNCTDSKKCCTFKAELTEDISPYKWIVLSNKTTVVDQEVDIFLCALIAPSANAAPKTFKNISISSNVDKSKITQSLPFALDQNLSLVDFIFNKDANLITLGKSGNIVVFGILQVLNSSGVEPTANVALIVVVTLLCITLVALLVGYLIWRKRQRKNRRAI